jgi:HEAT repeat protein
LLAAALPRAHGAVAVAIAHALGRTGSPRAEAPLLAALDGEDEVVWAAATTGLGVVGTAASVPRITLLAEGTRGIPREVALRALAQIRQRLTGVDPGRLALADGAEGELALAEDERGRVALPDEHEPA